MCDRLKRLQAENNNAGIVMGAEAARFAALASRYTDGTAPRAVSAFNLFQTPPSIARQMVAALGPLPKAARVLEPSAGLGRLYVALRAAHKEVYITMAEEAPQCAAELYAITEDDPLVTLRQGDFLAMTDRELFDAVIMNPPFKQGRDIKHIEHAAAMLKPSGVLVALCYNGSRQNKLLRPDCKTWEVLPSGTFKAEGTQAEVVMLTI